ncbi:hypothetical protein T07_8547, partial [Trichinella nelsoni]
LGSSGPHATTNGQITHATTQGLTQMLHRRNQENTKKNDLISMPDRKKR